MASSSYTEVVKERFDLFCSLCGLHGLPYLRPTLPLPIFERVLWVVIIAVNMVLSTMIIHSAWVEWVNSPFMITYDSKLSPIWEIPFPSVTLCSLVNIKKSVVDLSSTNDPKKLFFSSLICKNKEFFEDKESEITQEDMESFYNFLVRASPSCDEMFSKCLWQGVEFTCCQEFFPVVTTNGHCYVFNSLPSTILYSKETIKELMFNNSYPLGSRFWLPTEGYPQPDRRGDPGYHTFPKWSSRAGLDSGLTVELRGNSKERQEQCTGGYQGFKVIVDSPAEAPISTYSAVKVPMLRDFTILIDPMTIHTSEDFQDYDVHLRGCVFEGEQVLSNFGSYTTDNCILQCILDTSLEMCGCVSFYLPRNSSTRVCSDDSEIDCLELVSGTLVYGNIHKNDQRCVCYPPCNEVTYNYDTSHTMFSPEASKESDLNSSEPKVFSRISVHFNSRKFLGLHRQAESTLYDFLANCGGLLGLLTGFSCISAMEIVYHLLIRPIACLLLCSKRQSTPLVNAGPPIKSNKGFLMDYYYN